MFSCYAGVSPAIVTLQVCRCDKELFNEQQRK